MPDMKSPEKAGGLVEAALQEFELRDFESSSGQAARMVSPEGGQAQRQDPFSKSGVDRGTASCFLRTAVGLLLVVLLSVLMLSLSAAKGPEKGAGFLFEYVSVTLLQELCKFAISSSCLVLELWTSGEEARTCRSMLRWSTFCMFTVPGLLYCFDNNFQYVILLFLQPAELAIIWNFKVFATVVLTRVIFRRRYAWQQWAAMAVLVIGCALTQAPLDMHAFRGTHASHREDSAPSGSSNESSSQSPAGGALAAAPLKLIGALLAIVGACIAALSNVFCEWLMKRNPEDSIHVQNMQLYSFGIVLNSLTLLWRSRSAESPLHGPGGFFTGYTVWVWVIVLLGACSGLAVSVALKFVDNLVLIFAHSIAVLVVAAFSVLLFGVPLPVPFVVGGLLVLASVLVFHLAPPVDEARRRPPSDDARRGEVLSQISAEATRLGRRELTSLYDPVRSCSQGVEEG